MSDLRTDYTNDILADEMNGKRRFKLVKADGSSEIVSIEDVTEYEQLGSLFGAGDLNRTNQVVNQINRRPVNNNILVNSNFANPVNQRGFTTATGSYVKTYTIDRWFIQGSDATLTVADGCLVLDGNENIATASGLYQRLESLTKGTYSLSAKINGKIYAATLDWNDAYVDKQFEDGVMLLLSNTNLTDGAVAFGIGIKNDKISSANIEWAKLELSENATPYVPRLYVEEWLLCQRYCQKVDLSNSTCHDIDTMDITFVKEFLFEMRVAPTVELSECKLLYNGAFRNDFRFEIPRTSKNKLFIKAIESAHGYIYDYPITLSGYALLDSEL